LALCNRDTYEGTNRVAFGGTKMTLQQFYTYQEQTFDSYMGRLITNEGKDARRAISRRAKKEIAISQLSEREIANLAAPDTYEIGEMTFKVRADTVTVKDVLLGQAIAALPPARREVILLSYFLEKNDPQIGTLLNLTPNAIRYRRQTTLRLLKEILEAYKNEK